MDYATATYERLSPTRAIVEVEYSNGRNGAEVVDIRAGADLYEACYAAASVKAACQGARLERFREHDARRLLTVCHERIALPVERRPGNALNVEIGAPLPRCRLKTPAHWGAVDPRGSRWLMSGGSPLVLGACSAASCPRAKG